MLVKINNMKCLLLYNKLSGLNSLLKVTTSFLNLEKFSRPVVLIHLILRQLMRSSCAWMPRAQTESLAKTRLWLMSSSLFLQGEDVFITASLILEKNVFYSIGLDCFYIKFYILFKQPLKFSKHWPVF